MLFPSNSPVAAALLHRIQSGLSKLELVYTSHSLWPFPRVSTPHTQLRVLVLDASFNPPTLAHLALANSVPPPLSQQQKPHETNSITFDNHDYDVKLLLLSVRNADKTLKPGDATYLERLEMLKIFAQDIKQGEKSISESNVAIAMIDEPTFVGKSTILQTFFRDRFATSSQNYIAQLNFILGFDTFERLIQPRYYGSERQMLTSLRKFFSPEDDNSSVVCARRTASSYPPAEVVDLTVANEFISTGRISFIDIGEDLERCSSSEVRNTIRERGLDAAEWKKIVPPEIASYITREGLYNSTDL